MPTPPPLRFQLAPHPSTPCRAVHSLSVDVGRTAAGALRLVYRLSGDVAALRLPPASAQPQPSDGLWRHTCFEAFIGPASATAYREFNFSPSGDWAVYDFAQERVRADAPHAPAALTLSFSQQADALTLTAVTPHLPTPWDESADTLLGLSAVIESADGQLSYWALAHPRPQPDFHTRAGWTARLPAA